ncbi:MAG: type VI secretion system contractile sheath large subunit [Pseudomonadota bacterium]|nr:MAG: type VI secretion system contractile sheath large subunit [Pseudomonadota bacterium]
MAQTVTLERLLQSVRFSDTVKSPRPMITANLDDVVEDVTPEERFISSMAALLYNIDGADGKFDKQTIQDLVSAIDDMVEDQLNEILHSKPFQEMEATWTSIADLVANTNFRANIDLNLLDIDKDEALEDLELNIADIAGSELFKKIYVAEYDQFGGCPYGAIIGLYEFENKPSDIVWLRGMGKVAAAAHAPFVASASPRLFGCETMAEVNLLRDIEGIFNTPRYSKWNQLRDSEEAVYIGLTMPRYMVRPPYNELSNPAEGIKFEERLQGDDDSKYVWGSSAMLFARNLVKSFETSGWCQYIRGVKAGGLVTGLASYTYNLRGEDELRAPVEISMPDFRELELANAGIIPLIHKKGTAEAVFFSAQALKKSHKFKDPKDSENSQLVTNLSYTYSISRIAHYLKCIMRDNIGSTADAAYIQTQIDRWIARYVTTLVNPDDLTLRYYPFKAYSLEVTPIPGRVGWFHCNLSILPHIQFEGLNVDLRVDARLG